ncbi:hypothetical protein GF322_05025 [Candidatus Dependentiae bacterium]|nr:hypothetical protein [Candidatus Dependentiae bacterium]
MKKIGIFLLLLFSILLTTKTYSMMLEVELPTTNLCSKKNKKPQIGYLDIFYKLDQFLATKDINLNNIINCNFIINKVLDEYLKDQEFINWAINYAAKNRLPRIVKFLLKKGAKPNLFDEEIMTPLMWATYNADITIIRILLQHRVSPFYSPNENIISPYKLAIYLKNNLNKNYENQEIQNLLYKYEEIINLFTTYARLKLYSN